MQTEKIAFVCDDAETISAHFGRAPLVVIVTLQEGREIAREVRQKESGGRRQDHDHGPDHAHDHSHHPDPARGARKFVELEGCQALVVRGIGSMAVARVEQLGLRVYAVAEHTVDGALQAYVEGKLTHDPRRIHQH